MRLVFGMPTITRGPGKCWTLLGAFVIALSAFAVTASGAEREKSINTATPIKHLIVVIGENRSFDHIFGVYKPRDDQRIRNLLSRGIVKEGGSPGPNFRAAAQFTVLPQAKYFIAAPDGSKAAYITLHLPTCTAFRQSPAAFRRRVGRIYASPTSPTCPTAPISRPRKISATGKGCLMTPIARIRSTAFSRCGSNRIATCGTPRGVIPAGA